VGLFSSTKNLKVGGRYRKIAGQYVYLRNALG
jgi:hypothetical protein